MVFWHGLMVSMGLIVAIGAQNAYLLKQGLSKQHIAVVAGICFLGDFCLMTFGIMGAGTLFAKFPWLSLSLAIVGALFLSVYAYRCFKSAYTGASALHLQAEQTPKQTRKQVAMMAFALTFLNPHVYLDTVVILGGIAGTLSMADKWGFWQGLCSRHCCGFSAWAMVPDCYCLGLPKPALGVCSTQALGY